MLFIEFKRVFYVYTFISIKMYTIFWCFLLLFFFLQNPITRLHNLVRLIHSCGYISYEHKDRRSQSISKRSCYIQKKKTNKKTRKSWLKKFSYKQKTQNQDIHILCKNMYTNEKYPYISYNDLNYSDCL